MTYPGPANSLPSGGAKALLSKIRRVGRRTVSQVGDRFGSAADARWVSAAHSGALGEVRMQFAAPNAVCRYRADTFSSKEPETLDWIDEFGHLGALYDIGANVGLYSVYFAKSQPGTAYAFEPSALNLNLLVRNINANGVQDRVVVVANPLTTSNSIASFNLSSDEAGGAMSTFGETFGHDGKPLDLKLSYVTVGLSLDSLWAQGLLAEPPALIKIDVDGIEHLVLAGAHEVLGLESLKSILIEVNEEFAELKSGVASQLSAAGFQMRGKFHGDLTAGGQYSASFNQIWTR